jgi:protein-L-isoaspartate(D-aspartate) O-methyltransferase
MSNGDKVFSGDSEDTRAKRFELVQRHVVARGITEARLVNALTRTPRHLFVPEDHRKSAYEDHPLPIGYAQTISQPYMVAIMTLQLALQPNDRVLEIGTGSGYQTAILCELASHVDSVERLPELSNTARARLRALDYQNARVHTADGTLGWPDGAPYNAIMVTAGAPHLPEALLDQLEDGGRLVCPVGNRGLQELVKVTRVGNAFHKECGTPCGFVPLIGVDGWEQP